MTELFSITVRDNLGHVEDTISAGIVGVSNFKRSRTADGRMLGLWDGHGMRGGGVGGDWRVSRIEMFRSQGASTGSMWMDYQRRERRYAAIKGRIRGRRVGRSSGDLLRWEPGNEWLMPGMVSRTHPDYVQVEQRMSVTLGTTVPHARNHNLGVGRAPKHLGGHNIPRRPLLRLGEPFKRQIRLRVVAFAAEHTSAIGVQLNKREFLRTRGGRL